MSTVKRLRGEIAAWWHDTVEAMADPSLGASVFILAVLLVGATMLIGGLTSWR